ncbi:MAG: AraC family transcriptional regulator [Lachnospiraceae bacterium]|nr:AraC family transcriptional regulator [Lachnospiraceae bacterium]
MDPAKLTLDEDLLKIGKQDSEQYHRRMESEREVVDYRPDTTLRFFINSQAESYEMHWHPATELIMPIENTYTVIVGQTRYDLNPGEILLIPPGELHQLIAPPSGLRLIYIFDMEAVSAIKGFSYLTIFISHEVLITPETCPTVYEQEVDLILELCREYFFGGHLRALNCYASLLKFFANYGESRIERVPVSQSAESASERSVRLYEKLNTVFDYMDKHYSEDLSLETVADVAGFSKFHFSRLFKECSGYNFYDYLCLLRIKAAESLLMSKEHSITEVALLSGFSSLSTFNRMFKKKKGCTPSEYRAMCSQKMYDN